MRCDICSDDFNELLLDRKISSFGECYVTGLIALNIYPRLNAANVVVH